MPPEAVVPDIETDRAILIARALLWDPTPDCILVEAFEGAGLSDYLPWHRFAIDVTSLIEAISTLTEVAVWSPHRAPDRAAIRSVANDQLHAHLSEFLTSIEQQPHVVQLTSAAHPTIDVPATIHRWGTLDDPFPAPGSPEVEAHRRRMVRMLLAGANDDLYADLETVIDGIGLAEFMPTTQVALNLPGIGATTVSVPTSPTGNLTPHVLRQAVLDKYIATVDFDAIITGF
ncbi:hypothetical protein [Nocardia sp. NPDC050710]|uniref:hypothetical protein n=1 Tax=Nocardia sp. NPDC050710 TaxID=3157220 RepID=UPI0033D74B61